MKPKGFFFWAAVKKKWTFLQYQDFYASEPTFKLTATLVEIGRVNV